MAEKNGDIWVGPTTQAEAAALPTASDIDARHQGSAVEDWFEGFRLLCTALAAEARAESKRRFEE